MKGMQKISRGRGFRGALNYAFERESKDDEPGRLLGGNMSGQNAPQLSAEFGHVRRLRPDIEKPVWHNALRLPKSEKLTDAQWVMIADDYMQRMGFTESHPRSYVLHDDADGQHIHIVASRVSTEGKVYLGKNENLASTRHIQSLEREHGLTITKGPAYDAETGKIVMPESRQLKKGEVEMALRTGAEPPRQKLQRLINDAMADKPTAPQLAERLTAAGVTVMANVAATTGRCNGFSFEMDGVAFKGSDLGKVYSWKGLQERGLIYDQERDRQELGRYRAGAQPSPTAVAGENLTAADANLRTARRAAANLDRTAGNFADRAARRAVRAYLSSTGRDRSKVAATIDCSESIDRRQKYMARLLKDLYHGQISVALAASLAYVQSHDDYITIKLNDGGHIIDRGDCMASCSRNVTDAEIHTMVALAKLKDWQTIEPTGTDAFKARLVEVAMAEGLTVKGHESIPQKESQPSIEDQRQIEIVRLERERLQRARSNRSNQATSTPKFKG